MDYTVYYPDEAETTPWSFPGRDMMILRRLTGVLLRVPLTHVSGDSLR